MNWQNESISQGITNWKSERNEKTSGNGESILPLQPMDSVIQSPKQGVPVAHKIVTTVYKVRPLR